MPVIKQKTQFVNSAIGVSSFDTGADQVYQAVSNFANTVGKIAIDEGNKAAEQRGLKEAQSLTPEEVVEKSKQSPDAKGIQTIQAEAFDRVLERRFVDTIGNDIQLKSKEIAQKHQDPVSYERVFGNYLRDLTEGADDRFKGVVTSISKYEMADTKMTLAAAARRRAKAAAKASHDKSNNQAVEIGFDAANQENYEGALQVLLNRTEANSDVEQAGLQPEGVTKAQLDKITVSVMAGVMNNVLRDTADPVARSALSPYIMTQGVLMGDLIDEKTKAILAPFMPYVNTSNSSKILTNMRATNVVYDGVRAEEQRIAKGKADAEARQQLIDQGDAFESLESIFSRSSDNAVRAESPASAQGYIDSVVTVYESAAFDRQQDFINTGRGSAEEVKSYIKDVRRAALRSLALSASEDGNISNMKAYLVNGRTEELAPLSSVQRSIVTTLRDKNIYTDDDREYLDGFLTDSGNKTQIERDKQKAVMALNKDVNDLAKGLVEGSISLENAKAVQDSINAAVDNGIIKGPRATELLGTIGKAGGIFEVNLASETFSSFEMVGLSNYIKSSGSETLGVTATMREIGDAVIASTPFNQLESVSNHANSIGVKKKGQEAILAAKQKEQENLRRIQSGLGVATDKGDRELADKLIEGFGVDLTDPDSFGDERVMAVLRGVPSEKLIGTLNSLASNLLSGPNAARTADSIIQYYAALSKDPSPTGIFTNRFGQGANPVISMKTQAFLNDVLEAKTNTGESTLQIVQQLVDARSSDLHKQLIKERFKKQTPEQFLLQEYESFRIAEDFGATAEYYAGRGLELNEIKNKLDALIEGIYIKSDLVRDPMVPLSQKNRTPFALEGTMPDQGYVDALQSLIASELPAGFRLATETATPQEGDLGALYAQDFIEDVPQGDREVLEEDKKVYLVPREIASPATGKKIVSYFLHYAENNELKPLFMEKNGKPYHPMYNMEDPEMIQYQIQRAMEDDFKFQQDVEAGEERVQLEEELRNQVRSLQAPRTSYSPFVQAP